MTLSKKYIAPMVILLVILVGAIATGFVMGRETNRGGLDARIAAYIAANPEAIEKRPHRPQPKTKPSTYSQRHKTKPSSATQMATLPFMNSAIIIADSASVFLLTSWEVVQTDGNIRLVVKEYPILAESSVMAARLALHAAEIGKFEPVHHALMQWRGGDHPRNANRISDQTRHQQFHHGRKRQPTPPPHNWCRIAISGKRSTSPARLVLSSAMRLFAAPSAKPRFAKPSA